MNRSYSAVLRDGVLDWGEAGPPDLPPATAVPVRVTVLSDRPKRPWTDAAAALEALAAKGGVTGIDDPVEWQREIRKDRPLPGRQE